MTVDPLHCLRIGRGNMDKSLNININIFDEIAQCQYCEDIVGVTTALTTDALTIGRSK